MLSAAVEPILEAISIGRTDIIKKLLEEVEAEIKKSQKFENDQERGENCDERLGNLPHIQFAL